MTTKWVSRLITWYNKEARTLPWRSNPQPYNVWISEIMLQQTQVDTVIPYFERFLSKFPTVESLAKSELESVLKSWEGLGYYSRAKNLHKCANTLINKYNGIVPNDYIEIQKLPGIGPYCGAAITSIAYENPIPVVDGNVLRVFTRFWGIFDDIAKENTKLVIFNKLRPYIKETIPSSFNQAIMEIGALMCKPTQANCSECPLSKECFAYKNKQINNLPVKQKKAPVPHYEIGIGIIWKDKKVLIAKRKLNQLLGGLWEFPGGKQKENEEIKETIKREIFEETNLKVIPKHFYGKINHAYSHFKITLHAYECIYLSGEEIPKSSDEIKWITLDELKKYPFPKANIKIFDKLFTYHNKTN